MVRVKVQVVMMSMMVYGSIEFLWLGHKGVLASDLSASLLS